jgi:SAM-dependent methyltransferase
MNREIDDDVIQTIDDHTKQRYSDRLEEEGESVRTLGWGSREQQKYRFDQFLSLANYEDKVVLDVGCGFADFYDHLRENDVTPRRYIGIDLNDDLLEIARKNHPELDFIQGDPLAMETPVKADIIVMSGVLNYRQEELDNNTYAREFIECLFGWTRESLLVDMLSSYRDEDYPKEDFVFYYDPITYLEFGLTLTPHVNLKHDYRSIPQREFILKLEKDVE